MAILELLTSRPVIVSLAIIGGLIAMFGTYLMRENSSTPEPTPKLVLRSGYAITWASVVAFIVAGFLVD